MAEAFTNENFYRRYRRYYTYVEPIINDPLVRSYFTIIASLILVTVFLLFALSPTVNTIVGLLRRIEDQKAVLVALDQKINDLILAQETYNNFQPQVPLLESALPSKVEPETVISGIMQQATDSGVVVVSLQFEDFQLTGETGVIIDKANKTRIEDLKIVPPGVQILPFSLGLRGTRENILGMIQNVENLPRIVKVSTLSFTDGGAFSGDGLVNASLEGLAFFYK